MYEGPPGFRRHLVSGYLDVYRMISKLNINLFCFLLDYSYLCTNLAIYGKKDTLVPGSDE